MNKINIINFLFIVIFWIGNSNANSLISYQSVYEIELDNERVVKNTFGTPYIKQANGQLLLDWFDNCSSWVSNQRMNLKFINSSGVGTLSDINYSLNEKYDGSEMTFALQVKENNMIKQRINGKAEKKKKVKVKLFDNREKELEFSGDIIFPHQHLKSIISNIKDDKKIVSHRVYEGSIPEKFLNVSTFINNKTVKLEKKLLTAGISNKFWIVRMAYYDENKQTPEMELTAHINQQGFVSFFKYDYPSYSLKMKLKKVVLSPTKCN